MEEHNIFEVGPEVSGSSMIGYQYHIDYLVNVIMNTNNNISITGIKRSGKTSLAKEVARIVEQKDEKFIFIKIDLAKYKSMSEFLRKIASTIKRIIKKKDELSKDEFIQDQLEELAETESDDFMYREILQDIFLSVCQFGYKIVLLIDEFDEATNLFQETADFELLRDWASNSDLKLSLMLISRRQVYMIEKRNFNNSTFHGIITSYSINGFNDDDIEVFVNTMQQKYNIGLEKEDIEKIKYYAGRSPYIWSTFGYEIVNKYANNMLKGEIDIDEIFRTHLVDLRDHYEAILQNLSDDKICVNEQTLEANSIDKLNAIIFGPKIGVVREDIDVMKSLGYLDYNDEVYYSISKYFTGYLRTKYSPGKNSLFEAIINVEKKLKSLLNREMLELINKYEARGTHINGIQKNILFHIKGIEDGAIAKYENFIRDNKRFFEKESTYFDVISLRDTIKIISASWKEIFCKYFNCDEYDDWKEIFSKCGSVRNPIAHGHEEFLTEEERKSVDLCCKRINEQLLPENVEKVSPKMISENELIGYVKEKIENETIETVNSDDMETFIFVGEKTTGRKNLQGHLQNGEVGSISNAYFFKNDYLAEDFIGKEIPVRKKESNPQHTGYILEPVRELYML